MNSQLLDVLFPETTDLGTKSPDPTWKVWGRRQARLQAETFLNTEAIPTHSRWLSLTQMSAGGEPASPGWQSTALISQPRLHLGN